MKNVILSKILNLIKSHQKDIFLVFCMVLIAIIGFRLGRFDAQRQVPIKIMGDANVYQAPTTSNPVQNVNTTPTQPQDLRVVASKASSSKKYHFTWCPGAKKIKEANKLWFDNESLAQKAGYTLAGNCN